MAAEAEEGVPPIPLVCDEHQKVMLALPVDAKGPMVYIGECVLTNLTVQGMEGFS